MASMVSCARLRAPLAPLAAANAVFMAPDAPLAAAIEVCRRF